MKVRSLSGKRIIEVYLANRVSEEPFLSCFRRLGIAPFKERLYAKSD